MAKIEARFHPPNRPTGSYIIVGHITWATDAAQAEPRIEPSPMLALAPAPATILATLRHLVRRLGRSRERLETLRTQHWSFVDIAADLPSMSGNVS